MVGHPNDRWSCVLFCLVAASGVLGHTPSARAAEDSWRCGVSKRPWVELSFEEGGWDAKLQQSIRADLAAGLRSRGLLVCPPDRRGGEAPLASVQLSAASMTRVSVEIEVHDALTNKYVMREVDTRNVPLDARGLTLAAAAEELLRASWAELAIEDATPPVREPPEEVRDAVRPAGGTGAGHAIGVRMAGELYGGGQTLLGPDVWFDLWFGEYVAAELAIGYRRGLNHASRHGSIESEAAVASADALFAFAHRGATISLLARAGFALASLEYSGRPGDGGEGKVRSGVNVALRASLVLRLALGASVELRLEAGPGVSLRGLSALDAGDEVTGTQGMQGHAGLGLGAVF